MAKLHFSAMLLVVFAIAAVWSYPQGSSDLGLPSSPSSSESPQVYDAVNNEKLKDVLQYEQFQYDDLETSSIESVRAKRERHLTNAERQALAARDAARANQEINARRNAPNRQPNPQQRNFQQPNRQQQNVQQQNRQRAAEREAERRDMNNNHRLLNEMQNHWNRRN